MSISCVLLCVLARVCSTIQMHKSCLDTYSSMQSVSLLLILFPVYPFSQYTVDVTVIVYHCTLNSRVTGHTLKLCLMCYNTSHRQAHMIRLLHYTELYLSTHVRITMHFCCLLLCMYRKIMLCTFKLKLVHHRGVETFPPQRV